MAVCAKPKRLRFGEGRVPPKPPDLRVLRASVVNPYAIALPCSEAAFPRVFHVKRGVQV
jgi:hypothetical protein